MSLHNLIMKEVHRVTYHILLFIIEKIDYFPLISIFMILYKLYFIGVGFVS